MSEELEQEEVIEETVEEVEQEEVEQEAPRFSRDDWEQKQKEQASATGWKDFDDYVSDGGDPAKWKTADAYNIYGELVSTIKKNQRDFEQRIEGVQKLTQAQLAAERSRLQADRDQAIEDGNKTAVHKIDRQLNELNVPAVQPNSSTLDEWNAKNPWIFDDNDPKAVWAKTVWARASGAGKPLHEALAMVEAAVAEKFPSKVAPRKPAHIPESERGNGSRGFGSKASLVATMDNLTPDEAFAWNKMPEMWNNNPKAFLQSATDLRKAEKGAKK